MQLCAKNLVVERGSRTILRDVSFSVSSGEVLVLTGANGAGKTTLLRTLSGFLTPVSGVVRLEGGDAEQSIVEQAHVVGHLNGLKANLTVRENVEFWADYLDQTEGMGPRVQKALSHFALLDLAEFPAGYLSAGQKRRVGLARLLAAQRPLWLLDEPTASLDKASAKIVAAAIDGHTRSGGLAVVATHLELSLENAREFAVARERSAA